MAERCAEGGASGTIDHIIPLAHSRCIGFRIGFLSGVQPALTAVRPLACRENLRQVATYGFFSDGAHSCPRVTTSRVSWPNWLLTNAGLMVLNFGAPRCATTA